MSSAQDSIVSFCSNFKRLYKNKKKEGPYYPIYSMSLLNYRTVRHHNNYDLRPSDDGIYYRAHLLAEWMAY